MTGLILRRLGALVATLLIASFVVYGSLAVAPGGSASVLYGGRTPTPAIRAAVQAEYHLNDPFLVRYGRWLAGALHGDLGISVVGHRSVSSRIATALPLTFELVALAGLMVIVIGVGLGLLAALQPGPIDAAVALVSSLSVGVPSFVAASIGIDVFALRLHWFPAYGAGGGPLERLRALVLPAASLAIVSAALVTRVTRAAVHTELGSDYVVTATARAIPRRSVIRRHVLRNAAAPVLTAGGLQVASLFAGTVIVESAFGLQGIGSLLISSVSQKDYPTVQAITLLLVTAFVMANLVVDLLNLRLDPRTQRMRS